MLPGPATIRRAGVAGIATPIEPGLQPRTTGRMVAAIARRLAIGGARRP